MTYRQHMELHWRGAGGSRKLATVHTLSNPAADLGSSAGILTASQACSAAFVEVAKLAPVLLVGGSLGSSPYNSCMDYIKVQMRSAAGELVDYHVPAPIPAALSGSAGTVLDPGNALISALIDALIDGGSSSSGSPLISFVRGERRRVASPGAF